MDYNIEINNLIKSYGDFTLNCDRLVVPKGCITGFIGENGSGKTTTIKLILDLINRDSGEIKIFGRDNRETQLRQNIGVVLGNSFFGDLFRPKDISAVLSTVYKNWDKKLFDSYIERFKLPDKKLKTYSTGMKMKMNIAAALAHKPSLLILDEPTSGLDPIVRDEILDIFLEFIQNENNSIFISSHITGDLEKICDYITCIHNGKILFNETKDALIYDYAILKCGESDFKTVDLGDIISYRKNAFEYEILVKNKRAIASKYSTMVVDDTSIEQVMLMMVKGERV